MITVIGAGSGKAENITLEAFKKIKNAKKVFLRTEKMPISSLLKDENIPYSTLDEIFEESDDFDLLNKKTAEFLLDQGDCCYIVHGSALDDTSVRALQKECIEIIPGISVADCAGAYTKTAEDFKTYTSAEIFDGTLPTTHTCNIITCIDSRIIAGELKCILSGIYGDEYKTVMYFEDFEGNQLSKEILLYELDMQDTYNHTTSIILKKADFDEVYRYDIKHLTDIVARLCARDGCPWDSVQTHESLRPYLIEEAYEVAETIDNNDPYRLYDELGDVLLQVVFHSDIARKAGEFDFTDITDAICRKMISRHPALFGDGAPEGDLNDNWEKMKKAEKGLESTADIMHDVPEILPSLAYAEKIQHKAEKTGIKEANRQQNIENIKKMAETACTEKELGELLFETVNLCRACGIHPELALHNAVTRYISRFETKNFE